MNRGDFVVIAVPPPLVGGILYLVTGDRDVLIVAASALMFLATGYVLGHTRGKGDGYREARADHDYAEYMGRARGWP